MNSYNNSSQMSIEDDHGSTTTITGYMNRNMSLDEDIEDLNNLTYSHNEVSHESLMCENDNTKLFTMPIRGCHILYQTECKKQQSEADDSAWWFLYCYGVPLNKSLYCTFNRRETGGCMVVYKSGKTSSTSAIRRHLERKHSVTDLISM